MKIVFIILPFLLLSTSCKKDEADKTTNVQGTYQTSKTVFIQPPIMYLQNRQITDSGIINSYLRKKGAINHFFYTSTQTITDTLLKIIFGPNDSATLKYKNIPDIIKAKKILSTSNELIIQHYDSVMLSLSSYPETFHRCDTLGKFISKLPLLFHYNLLPPASGQYGYKVITPRFQLFYQNEELQLPMLSSCYNTTYNYPTSMGSCEFTIVDYWILKGSDIEYNLRLTDTIVIQEKSVGLKKIE